MTCEEIKAIKKIVKDMVITVMELEDYETGEDTDYSGVIDELRWNQMILENRLKTLKGAKL